MERPAAALCPPNFRNREEFSFKQSNKFRLPALLADALITPGSSASVNTMAGTLKASTNLDATIPITPSCHSLE